MNMSKRTLSIAELDSEVERRLKAAKMEAQLSIPSTSRAVSNYNVLSEPSYQK